VQLPGEELRCPPSGCPARRVQRVQLLVFGRPDQSEEVAADPGVVLRRDVEYGAGGNSGIDRVPADAHDVEARLRRERIARCHDTVACQHFGSSLSKPPLRA
jgi:hypothetical protein